MQIVLTGWHDRESRARRVQIALYPFWTCSSAGFFCFMTCPGYKSTPKLLQITLPKFSRLIREYILQAFVQQTILQNMQCLVSYLEWTIYIGWNTYILYQLLSVVKGLQCGHIVYILFASGQRTFRLNVRAQYYVFLKKSVFRRQSFR